MSTFRNGWETTMVDDLPEITLGSALKPELTSIIEELVAHPGTYYRVYDGEAKRVASRRSSLHSAIERRLGKQMLPKFRIVQRTDDGRGQLFAVYHGGER